jgi:hypothetical protein
VEEEKMFADFPENGKNEVKNKNKHQRAFQKCFFHHIQITRVVSTSSCSFCPSS